MFKLVVLSALFAAVVAEPSVLFSAPYTTYSSVVAPATTTITKSASSVVHPSPVVYSTPLAYTHYIKKRSAPLIGYNYGAVPLIRSYPYAATSLVASPLYRTSAFVPATPLGYTAAHLIKKRSPQIYFTRTTYPASPVYASTYATAPVLSTPLVSSTPLISSPITYSTHFIKKRSAPLLTTYAAPASFSQQSRVDITHNAPIVKVASYPTTFISQPYYY